MKALLLNKKFIALDLEKLSLYWWVLRICQVLLVIAVLVVVILDSGRSAIPDISFLSDSAIKWMIMASELAGYWQNIVTSVAVVLIGALGALASGIDPWKWRVVQSCLDEFRDSVFASKSHKNDFNYSHRVTLFRLQNGCIRMFKPWWRKWLVPIARSGTVTKATKSIFRFSDNPNEIEGVVGKAWCLTGWYIVEDLPLPSADMSLEQKADYYTKTNITVDTAIKMNYTARSYAATKVEVKGKPWGVLVLDSAKEKIPITSKLNPPFRLLASAVSPILESI